MSYKEWFDEQAKNMKRGACLTLEQAYKAGRDESMANAVYERICAYERGQRDMWEKVNAAMEKAWKMSSAEMICYEGCSIKELSKAIEAAIDEVFQAIFSL